MKKIVIAIAALLAALSGTGYAQEGKSLPRLGQSSIDAVLEAMTLEEKAGLLVGDHEFGYYRNGTVKEKVPGVAGTSMAIPRLGVTSTYSTDGPAGVNLWAEGQEEPYVCTAFPIGSLLACTWDAELVKEVGEAIGNEAFEYGCDIVLAPAINIQRNPLCGRNFEYYSEDPLLTGKIGAAFVNGIQSQKVGASVKHFAVNNQETYRRENDARVSQRALREIYLKNFEIVVKESHPWTVMSSYNRINGMPTQESYPLMTTILRDEWGFNGVVMTDWTRQLRHTALQLYSGNELLMPGMPEQVEDIVACVKNGRLAEETLNLSVRRMLELIVRTPTFKQLPYSKKPDLRTHAEIARRAATEGMVLLKNEEGSLPLDGKSRTVALFGLGSYDFSATGVGSGEVQSTHVVNLVEGLENAGYRVLPDIKALYDSIVEKKSEYRQFADMVAEEEVHIDKAYAAEMAKDADFAVVTLRRTAGEYIDRHNIEGDFLLTQTEQLLLKNVSEAFHAEGKKVVVVLNTGGVIETSSWKDCADAILLAWQAGIEGGNSVADILTGRKNPSGKLTMTWPVDYFDVPSSANFPYDFFGNSWREDWKKWDPYKKNTGYTNYDEGIWVGYRFFNTKKVAISFPFGFGLSYTTFEYSDANIRQTKDTYTVTVTITNTGKVAGKEVVELYVAAPANTMEKPSRELKAFAKTKELQPGESETVSMTFSNYDIASFSEGQNRWITETGTYHAEIGASVEDIRQSVAFKVRKQHTAEVLTRL